MTSRRSPLQSWCDNRGVIVLLYMAPPDSQPAALRSSCFVGVLRLAAVAVAMFCIVASAHLTATAATRAQGAACSYCSPVPRYLSAVGCATFQSLLATAA